MSSRNMLADVSANASLVMPVPAAFQPVARRRKPWVAPQIAVDLDLQLSDAVVQRLCGANGPAPVAPMALDALPPVPDSDSSESSGEDSDEGDTESSCTSEEE